MKLTNKTIYLDYNATSPLAQPVLEELKGGDVDFLNPSSLHLHGRHARRLVNQTINYFSKQFDLDHHRIFFHSGATEGLNACSYSVAMNAHLKKNKVHFISFKSDHPAARSQNQLLESLGHRCYSLGIGSEGEWPKDEVYLLAKKIRAANPKDLIFLNHLYVHNETGMIWPLEYPIEFKREFAPVCLSVDAVQSVGKLPSDFKPSAEVDFYTFSGHKFGALKGVGFSLIHNDHPWSPLINGGGQQSSLRSGTENVLGVHSLALAWQHLQKNKNYAQAVEMRKWFEHELENKLAGIGGLIIPAASNRASNTTSFYFLPRKADFLLQYFDQHGICLSSGSACSSGALKPNETVVAMGHPDWAEHVLRVSFDPLTHDGTRQDLDAVLSTLESLKSVL